MPVSSGLAEIAAQPGLLKCLLLGGPSCEVLSLCRDCCVYQGRRQPRIGQFLWSSLLDIQGPGSPASAPESVIPVAYKGVAGSNALCPAAWKSILEALAVAAGDSSPQVVSGAMAALGQVVQLLFQVRSQAGSQSGHTWPPCTDWALALVMGHLVSL